MQEIGRKIRKLLGKVINRVTVTAVLLILQAVWLWVLLYVLADYAKWINPVMLGLSLVMCAALIRQDSTVPEFKISWMILFAVMPVQGGILYLLWGNKRPALGLRHRLERAEDAMAPARKDDPDATAALQRQDPRAALTARYLHDYGP
ncbi:PLD nuclease N-terminal domain-containing protein, partial [bacterium]|nr:PLD nuclease N-terminal domain-containing protein [bacterium]